MANAGRLVVAAVLATMLCTRERRAWAQECPSSSAPVPLNVPVHIVNNAAVPESVLTSAKAYAAGVYARAGVGIRWLDGPRVGRENAGGPRVIVLMTSEAASRKAEEDGITDDVIGQAAVLVRRAYIYYARLIDMASPPDRDLVTFLGYAIAHELGHLLLPGRRHSSAGIMRAALPLSTRTLNTFIAADAALIRERLTREQPVASGCLPQ